MKMDYFIALHVGKDTKQKGRWCGILSLNVLTRNDFSVVTVGNISLAIVHCRHTSRTCISDEIVIENLLMCCND